MLIAKLFLPLSTPGLTAVGFGLVAVASGTYNGIEVAAIVVGLMTVAVAGVFTIRSNVAKIWREQAEGEKARNADLSAELADERKEHAADVAKMNVDWAAEVSARLHDIELEREAKERALAELADAHARTDLTAHTAAMVDQFSQLKEILKGTRDANGS